MKDQGLSLRVPSPKGQTSKPSPSPMASASEGETDSGITFVPKTRKGSIEASARNTPQQIRASPSLHSRNDSTSGSETVVSSNPAPSDLTSTRIGTPEKASTPRLAGQTITETELMRRRRLLDSYILD